jgi:hypothetical protein
MSTAPMSELITFDPAGFASLVKSFARLFIQLQGPPETAPIWSPAEDNPDEDGLRQGADLLRGAIEAAAPYLPLDYQQSFVSPLLANLAHVVRCREQAGDASVLAEALVGAVAQHARGSVLRRPLCQFLAVVSNLYRSFLSPDKRSSSDIPLALPQLPPLVAFSHLARGGPFVLPTPQTRNLCGSDVAVVSLPATYAEYPLAWVPLAHEASGHGVLHADPGLLPDLAAGVRTIFGGGPLPPAVEPSRAQALGLLWSYWIDETAADVCGLLNVGPAYALNLAAFLAAQHYAFKLVSGELTTADLGNPQLDASSVSDWNEDLDVHPPDLLRIHVAIGVIENLDGLSTDRAQAYVDALEAISRLCRGGQTHVQIKGQVEIERDRWILISRKLDFPIADARGNPLATEDSIILESARRVGAYIAATRLAALGNHTIQEIETWDDSDERVSLSIRDVLVSAPDFDGPADDDKVSIDSLGDDAQLLAGATLASFERTSAESFESINRRLAHALDRSYQYDPIMGFAEMHPMLRARRPSAGLPPTEELDDTQQAAPKTGAAIRPKTVKASVESTSQNGKASRTRAAKSRSSKTSGRSTKANKKAKRSG